MHSTSSRAAPWGTSTAGILQVTPGGDASIHESTRPLQVALRIIEYGLSSFHVRLRGLNASPGALQRRLRGLDARLGTGQVGGYLSQLSLQLRRVETRDDLAFLDLAVEIDIKFGDSAGHLSADLDRGESLHPARRRDRLSNMAALDHGGLNRWSRRLA